MLKSVLLAAFYGLADKPGSWPCIAFKGFSLKFSICFYFSFELFPIMLFYCAAYLNFYYYKK